jgi:uracil-DNA glycosylase
MTIRGKVQMFVDDVLNLIEEKVFPALTAGTLFFNQYNSINPEVDLPNANEIRRENLGQYLRSFTERPAILVVGEAPGWQGCRFSGVPFTSEYQLCNGILPFNGVQSSKKSSPYKENTATIFWEYMYRYHPKFFAWNCIPFHPHKPNDFLSNRNKISRKEILKYLELLIEMVSIINPKKILAVGRKAEFALKNMKDISFEYVRHPSHGGANAFKMGMEKVFLK